jgi:hypothetical protein
MSDDRYEQIQRRNRLPTDQLLALPDDYQLVIGVSYRIAGPDGDQTALEGQNGPQTVVSLAEVTAGIVGNGGLEYLFEGWYAGDLDYSLTLGAFISLGASEWSSVFSEVLAALPTNTMPDEVEARHLAFLKLPASLRKEWNSRLWDSSDTLIKQLASYIRKNRSSFTMLRPLP